MANGQTGEKRELTASEKARVRGKLVITNRELQEFRFAMDYAAQYAHGTTGHGQFMLLARTAHHIGFRRSNGDIPAQVIVDDELAALVNWNS